ncbi:MAG: hypothetical protein JRJ85_10110, partial [Deltaproteobacteria bacterium]|nr:hypothetical protein [Deltaproteobacteria bacterium]
ENGRKKIEKAEKDIKGYKKIFRQYVLSGVEIGTVASKIKKDYGQLAALLEKGFMFHETMVITGKVLHADFIVYENRPSVQNWAIIKKNLDALHKHIEEWYPKIENSDDVKKIGDGIKSGFQGLKTEMVRYHDKLLEQGKLRTQMNAYKNNLMAACAELGRISTDKLKQQTRVSLSLILGFILAALLFGAVYAVISIKTIVGKLKTVIHGVAEGADQVAKGAQLVSSASHSLAEASSEQAASIEETSSSLEEMSSMTKQNADHATEAKNMISEASEILEKVNNHMNDMASAIQEINNSSRETEKIIKTIDEIAFQTNLLALNAAVEAARAGEAGAGFAVVADEVRNLAMRAAEAAKNTAELIENTIKAVKNGSELTELTRGSFNENLEISGKVTSLIEEIAEASNEQADGIEQVNRAVGQMDQVVQRSAGNTEESATAAREMNQEAIQLKGFVNDLAALVDGNKRNNIINEGISEKKQPVEKTGNIKTISPESHADTNAVTVKTSREVSPEHVTPMGDEDFKDF